MVWMGIHWASPPMGVEKWETPILPISKEEPTEPQDQEENNQKSVGSSSGRC